MKFDANVIADSEEEARSKYLSGMERRILRGHTISNIIIETVVPADEDGRWILTGSYDMN